ncbi:eukaryotic translation initiation factor 3 subunit C [Suhomyces tanzawaensis NRRL Y-17324]|uniref:Eukaryotic translation initiation factor 3 subunit C n=1 Tax=Suhomyces tanzawaensis NRRL Y-17324 TaxID=984487 RepID=A0A1E4SQC8_9ASCO|nr:eukaryotic translation initiation factor 3 subunit C [Suhomyces tanzawaensis NRRL Y-17324]ODV81720.1 eukaryotic translation initiation factor 3 subunit C [Suhomyces tanzawaensis NRRL Y-17324]
MSRFFVSGYNSESSSEEEDLLSSSEEELLSEESTDSEFGNDSDSDDSDSDSDGAPSGPSYFLKKSFMKGSGGDSDSDSEDEGRKVVKSAKEKLMDDIRDSIEAINVAKRTNSWSTVVTEFDKLNRFLLKSSQQGFGTPNVYIKCLGGLDDYINATLENEKSEKTLNAIEARAINTARQRLKKQIKENQVFYDLFREQPELFDTEEPLNLPSSTKQQDDEANNRLLNPVFATLKQIAETRGKKNIDKYEQIQTLEELLQSSNKNNTFELISIYQTLLSIRFDASSNQAFMPLDLWKQQESDLNALLDLLESKFKSYQFSEYGKTTDEIDIEPEANADGVKVIFGSITSLVDRLDDEFTRSLQNTDPHSIEYVERLKDEGIIYKLIVRGQTYVERVTSEDVRTKTEQLPRVVLRRLEHVYYKPDQLIKANEAEAWKGVDTDSSLVSKTATPAELIEGLCQYLSSHTNKIYGKHALLLSIYYYAVNGNYARARDLFLNSQIYNGINHFDSTLQVQYNRALVQLGLSAFRSGAIEESNRVLNEIVNSQRSKELLGQGFNSKYPNQATVVEKQKLLPFHQHINLELLECVHMTCSLLLEIPALAASSNSTKENKRKANIKSFKSKLEFHDRQFFTGPPESIKDHIVHASIALQKGDWSKAYNLLSSIKIWKLFPGTEELLTMMKNQLQVEGLRTYIFTYRSIFTKLSIAKLSKVFDLPTEKVVEILDAMLEGPEVSGAFDDNKTFINFTSSEPQRSRLQELAIVMNEKVGLLTEKNEKTSSNGFGKKQPAQQQQQQQQQQREQKDSLQEENNKFRYANVNSNNDEFQAAA